MNSSLASSVRTYDWKQDTRTPSLLWYAPVIFAGAFLLFLVQPIVAKQILPWFGGSAAVWTTALVFFQGTLLAGYAYAHLITRLASRRAQVSIHIGLLACSLLFLPILVDGSWKPQDPESPGLRIIGLLMATIGLPFFLLSSTGPLIQSWFSASFAARRVYRLFALSNAASLAGLLSYPFLIEPWVSIQVQADIWSGIYLLFAIACAAAGLKAIPFAGRTPPAMAEAAPGWRAHLTWLLLAALASFLLIATTTHLTRDIASIPFLWIVPLTLYLLTFALCFDSERWYRRKLFLPAAIALLVACGWALQSEFLAYRLWFSIPLYVAGLFVFCMVLHGELAAARPAARHLTRFYLAVALGGALGGLFGGMAIPYLLPANFELGIGFILFALAGTLLQSGRPAKLAAVALAFLCTVFSASQISETLTATRVAMRNFYGTVQTYDTPGDEKSPAIRALVDGVIVHGEQYLDPAFGLRPIGYYGEGSGIGRLMRSRPPTAQKVAVIGLGAGTMAAFGRAGDQYRFYEINPHVVQVAKSEFTYLRDSKALITYALGDGRLSLEREAPQDFDIIVVDAFSSDSVPVHLLTREALETYLKHLSADGTIVFNVTNRYLNIASVALNLARQAGLSAAYIRDRPSDGVLYNTEYVLISRQANRLEHPLIAEAASPPRRYSPDAYWTDDFSNLLRVLRRGGGR